MSCHLENSVSFTIHNWSLVIGHWSLVIGHWSLVIGHWSLVIGHWSFQYPPEIFDQSYFRLMKILAITIITLQRNNIFVIVDENTVGGITNFNGWKLVTRKP